MFGRRPNDPPASYYDEQAALTPADIPPPCYIQDTPDEPIDEPLVLVGLGLVILAFGGFLGLCGLTWLLYLTWTS